MQPYIRKVSSFFYNRTVGLLLLRVAAGAIFVGHGFTKMSDMSSTMILFDAYGLTPFIAIVIAWVEVLGGVSLILGIAPRIAAAILGLEMLIAAIALGRSTGFSGVELELLLAVVCFGIMTLGSGRYALYKMECDNCNGLLCIKKNNVCVMAG